MSNKKLPHEKKTVLDRLEPAQREAMQKILDKIGSGKKINKGDLAQFVDYTQVSSGDVCKVCGMGRTQLMMMVAEHPEIKNNNGTYNLIRMVDIIRIRTDEDTEGRATLEEKYFWQVKKLKIEISDLQEQTIPKTEHEQILATMAASLNTFLTQTSKMNLHQFENKSVKDLKLLFAEYNRQMMYAFISGKPKDEKS